MADVKVRQNDLLPGVSTTLLDQLGQPVPLPSGSSCQMVMTSMSGATVLSAAATIADQTASPGVVSYAWQPGDTATAGDFGVTFTVTYPSGRTQTFPTEGTISVRIPPMWEPEPPIGLAEVKAHLNYRFANFADDAEIPGFLDAAIVIIESKVGPITPIAVTERIFTSNRLIVPLSRRPVISITSVVQAQTGWWGQDLIPLDNAAIWLDGEAGLIERVDGYYFPFAIDVGYVAGRTSLKPNLRLAILELTAHTWQRSQQSAGGSGGFVTGGSTEDFDRMSSIPGAFAGVPNRVLELLGDDSIPGIA